MRTCAAPGCVRQTQAKGLCSTHYQRMRKGVPLDAPMRKSRIPQPCSVRGCDQQGWARGFCPMHYYRWRTRGDTGSPWSERPGGSRFTMHPSGYVRLHAPNHPQANCDGYILEHRLVMEQMIGRPLLRFETVHHKNGVRDDNRPENLELRASHHGSGQSVEDLIAFVVQHYPKQVRAALRRRASDE